MTQVRIFPWGRAGVGKQGTAVRWAGLHGGGGRARDPGAELPQGEGDMWNVLQRAKRWHAPAGPAHP